MASTYEPIATTTLGSASSTVTFSSIPSTYTDLILIGSLALTSSGGGMKMQLNSDTATNYSWTFIQGDGTSAVSGRASADNKIAIPPWQSQAGTTNNTSIFIVHLQNYSNTTTYKTVLARGGDGNYETAAHVGLWRSTSAINSITILNQGGTSIKANSTFTLYGVTAA